MKRREFCASAVATLGTAALPFGWLYAAPAKITSDVEAVTFDGKRILLPHQDVEALREQMSGPLLLRDMDGYDQARKIFNGMFDKHPALIALCMDASDVQAAVGFAAAHELLLAVRGGGHSLSGQSVCDDGLMIDLAPMRKVTVDTKANVAHAGGGALLGDVDRATLAAGLVTPTGTVSHTGCGGLTLGGGFGRLGRRFGMTCDQVMSADIVMASGKLQHVSAEENADLHWAIRGGGGNFGVVTSFEYKLHPFDGQAVGGRIVYPLDQARDPLRAHAELMEKAPDELWIEPVLTRLPSGERVLVLDVCYTGAAEQADAALAPFRVGKPLADEVGKTTFTQLQTQDDKRAHHGGHYYTKAGFVMRLSNDLIDLIVDTIASAEIPGPRIAIVQKGGASMRVASDATAFWYRQVPFNLLLQTSTDDPAQDAANIAWVKAKWPAFEKFAAGFYANTYLSDTPANRMREAYGGNYDRLQALKTQYDPRNLFRLNANIQPRA